MIEIKSEGGWLEVAKSGVIWGSVWFELNGEACSEVHWNDLVVAVMVEVLIGRPGAQEHRPGWNLSAPIQGPQVGRFADL